MHLEAVLGAEVRGPRQLFRADVIADLISVRGRGEAKMAGGGETVPPG